MSGMVKRFLKKKNGVRKRTTSTHVYKNWYNVVRYDDTQIYNNAMGDNTPGSSDKPVWWIVLTKINLI